MSIVSRNPPASQSMRASTSHPRIAARPLLPAAAKFSRAACLVRVPLDHVGCLPPKSQCAARPPASRETQTSARKCSSKPQQDPSTSTDFSLVSPVRAFILVTNKPGILTRIPIEQKPTCCLLRFSLCVVQPERLRFLSAGKPLEVQALRTIALVLLFASVVTPAFAQKKKSNSAPEPKESATQQQAAAPVGAAAQQEDAESKDPWKALNYRLLGPFRGGRVVAVSAVVGQANTAYFRAVAGGLRKKPARRL